MWSNAPSNNACRHETQQETIFTSSTAVLRRNQQHLWPSGCRPSLMLKRGFCLSKLEPGAYHLSSHHGTPHIYVLSGVEPLGESHRASVKTGHQNWMPSATPNRPVLWYLFLWRAYLQSFRAADEKQSEWKKERVWRRMKAWHQSLTKSELLGLDVKIQSK